MILKSSILLVIIYYYSYNEHKINVNVVWFVCLADTSSERSVTEDEDDDNDSEELHGSRPVSINKSSEAYKANQDLPSSIEKTDDDNAVDFDLFDFQEQPDICSPDNLNEDLNTFDDFKSETVDELREIITSDEDTKFGDILSQQLLSSPCGGVHRR